MTVGQADGRDDEPLGPRVCRCSTTDCTAARSERPAKRTQQALCPHNRSLEQAHTLGRSERERANEPQRSLNSDMAKRKSARFGHWSNVFSIRLVTVLVRRARKMVRLQSKPAPVAVDSHCSRGAVQDTKRTGSALVRVLFSYPYKSNALMFSAHCIFSRRRMYFGNYNKYAK